MTCSGYETQKSVSILVMRTNFWVTLDKTFHIKTMGKAQV